jgi:CheY-like chemotaxis protein
MSMRNPELNAGTPPGVLVIEDDVMCREALAQILRDSGHDVVAFSDGGSALDYLRHGPAPRVIVLDLIMPGMDGWDFRHEQLREPLLAQIPVIAVSAGGKLPDAAASFRKPLDVDRFLSAVDRFVTIPFLHS